MFSAAPLALDHIEIDSYDRVESVDQDERDPASMGPCGEGCSKLGMFTVTHHGRTYYCRNPDIVHCLLEQNVLHPSEVHRLQGMHLPADVCPGALRRHLSDLYLHDDQLMSCCRARYMRVREAHRLLESIRLATAEDEQHLQLGHLSPARAALCRFLEDPFSSKPAMAWSSVVLLLCLVSIFSFCIQTSWRPTPEEITNKTAGAENITDPHLSARHALVAVPVWMQTFDAATLIILTAELVVRFLVYPDKQDFCRHPGNIADFISTIPSWAAMAAYYILRRKGIGSLRVIHVVVIVLKMLRLFRLVRLARQYRPLRAIFMAFANSVHELLLLVVMLLCATILYASLVYHAEVPFSTYSSIPHACWWAITTMTTVGFGTDVPKSGLGRLVGSACAVTGILIISITMPVITNKFSLYYHGIPAIRRQSKLRHLDVVMAEDHEEEHN